MDEILCVNGTPYRLLRLLGHGKGGYSYLARNGGGEFVLKQIHHEPCSYYTFGNKIEAEHRDYHRLRDAGIRIPKMLEIDFAEERVLKEYIPGPTVYELVKAGEPVDAWTRQVREMAAQARAAGMNIDYFPTNFVVSGGLLYYVDYECNAYMEQWNFENWGIRYWSRTPEFLDYDATH